MIFAMAVLIIRWMFECIYQYNIHIKILNWTDLEQDTVNISTLWRLQIEKEK